MRPHALGGALLLALAATPASAQETSNPTPFQSNASTDETPFGYQRDPRGKLMQTQFDMNRRVWIGGGWAPTWSNGPRTSVEQGELELGARIETVAEDQRWRGRFHLFDSSATVGGTTAQGTLFSYDESRESKTPVLRVTTFWNGPERHDVYLNLGFWAQALSVVYRPRGVEVTELRPIGLGVTWDLWHSRDLEDFARLRVGGALDDTIEGTDHHFWSATSIARLETDVVIDPAGFHRITAEVGVETPLALDKEPRGPVLYAPPFAFPALRANASATLAYEVIVLAVNDQPITLRLAGLGGYRDDLPTASGLELGANATVRVNLWAPAPRGPQAATPRRAVQ